MKGRNEGMDLLRAHRRGCTTRNLVASAETRTLMMRSQTALYDDCSRVQRKAETREAGAKMEMVLSFP